MKFLSQYQAEMDDGSVWVWEDLGSKILRIAHLSGHTEHPLDMYGEVDLENKRVRISESLLAFIEEW